jgi:polyisoprenoid-binding protein YceI
VNGRGHHVRQKNNPAPILDTPADVAVQEENSAMKNLRRVRNLFLALFLLAPCGVAWADWELDNTKSVVNFVSIKNNGVGEIHSFASLVGFIGAAGNVQLTINLDSVKTLIEIRDERMRELLFETVKFPAAQVTAQVDPTLLAEASRGKTVTAELPITLALHGQEKPLTVSVAIVGEDGGSLRVLSTQPVVINAADFGMDSGVAALKEIAGLQSISNAVPVTLQLLFVEAR